jgi:hypothetical protein
MNTMRGKYNANITLNHNEAPAKKNMETGEYNEIKPLKNNIPEGHSKWSNGFFRQPSIYGLEWMYNNLSDVQYRMTMRMIQMMGENNTLKPLNDDTGINILMEYFKLSRNTVIKNIKILFDKGIYGRFEVSEQSVGHSKYWILNPYISVAQGTMPNDTTNLFRNTDVAIYCQIQDKMRSK